MVMLPGSIENRRIAMLIDGDNAQPSLIESILAEVSRYGLVTVRRIYGDWTTANMNGWKETLHVHAIQPVQQFRYTIGKNATDSALIIDGMDLLHQGNVNGFCLVSSDSDYTRLATRIREDGLFVMGIGRQDTPKSFVNGCEVFVFTENLAPNLGRDQSESLTQKPQTSKAQLPQPLLLLKSAIETTAQEDGWAFLGTVGARLRQLDPSFDPRTYGHKRLALLVKAFPQHFEVKETRTRGGPSVVYVRMKE